MVTALKKKRGLLEVGDTFAVPLGRARFGYAQVVRCESFGDLFVLFRETTNVLLHAADLPSRTLTDRAFAYVNSAAVKRDWAFLGRIDSRIPRRKIPTFFHGSSVSFWTARSADGREKIFDAEAFTFEDMRARGFQQKVIWLGEDIVRFLRDGKPLKWRGPV
jgi:hypothetical protein